MMSYAPFSREMNSQLDADGYTIPKYVGTGMMFYAFSTNMVNLSTEEVVGVFSAFSMQDEPVRAYVDFFLTDPKVDIARVLGTSGTTKGYVRPSWVDLTVDQLDSELQKAESGPLVVTDEPSARQLVSYCQSHRQFGIPLSPTIVGMLDDYVRIEAFKHVVIRTAWMDDPDLDVFVQITPQTLPGGVK